MQIYQVKSGDSLEWIADYHGVTVDSIIYENQLVSPYQLVTGQALLLPGGCSPEEQSRIFAGGYAYPFIERQVLDQTLPFLSELMVFSYGFNERGNLIPPAEDDLWMTARAKQFAVRPIITLAPLGANGNFDNNLIRVLLENEAAQDQLVGELLETMAAKNYGGLDIDFEYILAADREPYTDFVRYVTERLNASGYQVSVALAPVSSAAQRSILSVGQDYQALGEAANHVFLMTYEWGYKYGPNMAVAPLDRVREVVEYAITQIPPGKISLGIPNYGYDWLLPLAEGVTEAATISNVEAIRIAAANDAVIQFDAVSMSPYFRYLDGETEHEVWFEDVRSLQAKYELIEEYGLRGCRFWQIMALYRPGWLRLANDFWIAKYITRE